MNHSWRERWRAVFLLSQNRHPATAHWTSEWAVLTSVLQIICRTRRFETIPSPKHSVDFRIVDFSSQDSLRERTSVRVIQFHSTSFQSSNQFLFFILESFSFITMFSFTHFGTKHQCHRSISFHRGTFIRHPQNNLRHSFLFSPQSFLPASNILHAPETRCAVSTNLLSYFSL